MCFNIGYCLKVISVSAKNAVKIKRAASRLLSISGRLFPTSSRLPKTTTSSSSSCIICTRFTFDSDNTSKTDSGAQDMSRIMLQGLLLVASRHFWPERNVRTLYSSKTTLKIRRETTVDEGLEEPPTCADQSPISLW
jgi:hypothetical protein